MNSRYFSAFCLHHSTDPSLARFGFTVPRALGKAVQRNRIRRRLREAVRTQLEAAPAQWFIIFNPRRSVLAAPFEDLRQEVGRIFAQCRKS